MTTGGDVDLYRELVETKLENGLNSLKEQHEKLHEEARKEHQADISVLKDECDQIQIAIEKLGYQLTEVANSLKAHKEGLPHAIDLRIEERRKTFAEQSWAFTKKAAQVISALVTIIVSIIIIRAWMTGGLTSIDMATSIPT